jgi:hypothetical protein
VGHALSVLGHRYRLPAVLGFAEQHITHEIVLCDARGYYEVIGAPKGGF